MTAHWRGRLRASLEGWLRNDGGVAAVEFGLIAPIFAFALLASVDLGRALTERMAIDHALRAAAQMAMTDPGATPVYNVMKTTAEVNIPVAPQGAGPTAGAVSLATTRYCACPESTAAAVVCSTICANSNPTFTYYNMTAQKRFDGWIVPAISFAPAMLVQVR